ncbi:MAG: Uncharacterised protein [SAR116 cluster bacterium]|nr:MAG: Uncharacterised protein [SAR116 cluster bacterium]
MRDLTIIKAAQHMGDRIHLADICEELVAKPFTLGRTAHKASNIHKFQLCRNHSCGTGQTGQRIKPRVWHRNAPGIWLDRAEGIVGCLGRGRFGQRIEKG